VRFQLENDFLPPRRRHELIASNPSVEAYRDDASDILYEGHADDLVDADASSGGGVDCSNNLEDERVRALSIVAGIFEATLSIAPTRTLRAKVH
jgi:hypothetical protein